MNPIFAQPIAVRFLHPVKHQCEDTVRINKENMFVFLQKGTSLVYEGMLIQDVSYGFLMDIDSVISIQEAFNSIGYKALEPK